MAYLRLAGLAERAEGVGERGGLRPGAAATGQDVEQREEVAPVGDVGERPHHGVLGPGALVHHHQHPLPPRRRRGLLRRPAVPAAAAPVAPAAPRLLPARPPPRPPPAAAALPFLGLPVRRRRAPAVARAQLAQEVLAAAAAAPHRSPDSPARLTARRSARCERFGGAVVWCAGGVCVTLVGSCFKAATGRWREGVIIRIGKGQSMVTRPGESGN